MGRLKKVLYAIAEFALDEIRIDGPLLMDVLIVRVYRSIAVPSPFEMADAGVRLAVEEGWLSLKDGVVSHGSQTP